MTMTLMQTWFGTVGFVLSLFALGKYYQVVEKKNRMERRLKESETLTQRAEEALKQVRFNVDVEDTLGRAQVPPVLQLTVLEAVKEKLRGAMRGTQTQAEAEKRGLRWP